MKSVNFIKVAIPILLFASLLFYVNVNDQITKIEVIDVESEELITTITDKAFIQKLLGQLNNSETHSTIFEDYGGWKYQLIFYKNEEVQEEIVYFNEDQYIEEGLYGRYLNLNKEVFYGVTLELPIE